MEALINIPFFRIIDLYDDLSVLDLNIDKVTVMFDDDPYDSDIYAYYIHNKSKATVSLLFKNDNIEIPPNAILIIYGVDKALYKLIEESNNNIKFYTYIITYSVHSADLKFNFGNITHNTI